MLSPAVKVFDLNMRVRLSRLRNGGRAVVSVMLEAIMHLTDALLLFRRLGVDPPHSRLRLVRPMLRLSEYSSGLRRSTQGPNPDEIVTKVPKVPRIHPMVEMVAARLNR